MSRLRPDTAWRLVVLDTRCPPEPLIPRTIRRKVSGERMTHAGSVEGSNETLSPVIY
jgi:hypothetical protein